jgi:hypothetical protein
VYALECKAVTQGKCKIRFLCFWEVLSEFIFDLQDTCKNMFKRGHIHGWKGQRRL